MSEIIELVARALYEQANDQPDRLEWGSLNRHHRNLCIAGARAAIEAMRAVPDLCYDQYRCDNMWRDLNSTKVWNLWLDAALHE